MALKEKKSILDRNIKGVEGQPVGQNPPSEGSYFADAGTSDSPFDTVRGPKMDQMVQMLTNNVKSENSGQTYIPSPNKSPYQDLDGAEGPKFDTGKPSQVHGHPAQLPNPSELVEDYTSTVNPWANYGNSQWPVVPAVGQDLNGADGGQGYFHGMANPEKGQGKQINGVDLHEHLLTKAYTYSHTPGVSTTILLRKGRMRSNTGGTFDLDNNDAGQGYFHGMANPGKGQGKQIKGVDLHEHLLTKAYKYSHGNAALEVVGPSPGKTGNSEYQDLNTTTDGIGDANLFHNIYRPGKYQGIQIGGKDLHEHLLTKGYTYGHGLGTTTTVLGENERGHEGGKFDLDAADGPAFHGGVKIGNKPTLHTDLLSNIYKSKINTLSNYGAGQPGGTWPNVQPSPLASTPFADLDGGFASPNSNLGQFGGPYRTTGPTDGFY